MASDLEFFAAELKKYNVAVQKIYLAYDDEKRVVDKNAVDAILHGLERWHNVMKSALFSIESNSNVKFAYSTIIVESGHAITQLQRPIVVDGKQDVLIIIRIIIERAKRSKKEEVPLPEKPEIVPSVPSIAFPMILRALKEMDVLITQSILRISTESFREALPRAIETSLVRDQSPTPMYWTLINAYLQIPIPVEHKLLPSLGILCQRDHVEPNLAQIIGSTQSDRLHIRHTLEVLNYYAEQMGMRLR